MSTVIIGGGGGHQAEIKADFYVALRPDLSECVGPFQTESVAKDFCDISGGVWRVLAVRSP